MGTILGPGRELPKGDMPRRSKQAEDGGTRLSSVANAILLMKSFSDEHSELGISALAERLGLAKSTVHRLASAIRKRNQ